MSQALFPTLPGLSWPVGRTPMQPPVHTRTTPSLREFRVRNATVPRYTFTLNFDILRGSASLAEWQTLEGFFNQRGGSFDDFLFLDPADSAVTANAFGTGNGVTTQFQLLRTLGGYAMPVYGYSGTPQLFSNGSSIGSGYSIDTSGLVTFASAPASGAALTWTGTFCWRVRFVKDQTEFNQFMRDFWEAKKVELITVKP